MRLFYFCFDKWNGLTRREQNIWHEKAIGSDKTGFELFVDKCKKQQRGIVTPKKLDKIKAQKPEDSKNNALIKMSNRRAKLFREAVDEWHTFSEEKKEEWKEAALGTSYSGFNLWIRTYKEKHGFVPDVDQSNCEREKIILPGDGLPDDGKKSVMFAECVNNWYRLTKREQQAWIDRHEEKKKKGFREFLRNCQCEKLKKEKVN